MSGFAVHKFRILSFNSLRSVAEIQALLRHLG